MDLVLAPISIAKKPVILLSDALNYVAFLAYYSAVNSASDKDAEQYVSGFSIFLFSYAVAFAGFLHLCISEIRLGESRKIQVLVHERIISSVSWALLYAALVAVFEPVENSINASMDHDIETTKWLTVLYIGALCAALVAFCRVLSFAFYFAFCFCCFGGCAGDPGTFSDAKNNAGVLLQQHLTSSMAWLLAVKWTAAIDTSIETRISSSKDMVGVYSWLNFVLSIVLALMVIYANRAISSKLHLENSKKALGLKGEGDSDRKKHASIITTWIDLTDETCIFIAVSALRTAARTMITKMYKNDAAAQNNAVLVFCVMYMIVISALALIIQWYLRRVVKSRSELFELVFLKKISTFLNRGFSGALGQLLHGAGNFIWEKSTVKGAQGIYMGTVTLTAVVLTSLLGCVPGDLQLIDIPKDMLSAQSKNIEPGSVAKGIVKKSVV